MHAEGQEPRDSARSRMLAENQKKRLLGERFRESAYKKGHDGNGTDTGARGNNNFKF